MSKVDWSKAPEGAEFFAADRFCKVSDNKVMFWNVFYWCDSMASPNWCKKMPDYQVRPTQWPEDNKSGQNGGDELHYDEQRDLKEIQEKLFAREAHLKQSEEQNRAPDSLGKYDRRIKGKHNTGPCTVDVYRVLSAFEVTEPELQHAIKKLLAAGQRGAKDYQQDLREAAISLSMLIDRLAE